MSGWIKLEKDLLTDPRVIRIGAKLCNGTALRGVTVVLGGLAHLWMIADTHVAQDDVIPLGADDINDVIGIEGFCQLLPSDWLQIIDSDHVKLPGFHTHNGTVAKERAQTARRVQRHRDTSNGHALPQRNGRALPDLDQDQDLNQDRNKSKSTHAKADPREAESEIREHVMIIKAKWPKGAGHEDWITAEKLIRNLVSDGTAWDLIESGVERYAKFCKATNRMVANPGKWFAEIGRPWLSDWAVPSNKAEAARDTNIENSKEWLHAS